MKFDAKNSTKYQLIMDAAVSFFGLDAATATEADVHAAFDGQKPLTEQLEAARTAAVADLQKQFDELKTGTEATTGKMTDLQKQFDEMKADIETKDGRILELTNEKAVEVQKLETAKKQHKTELDNLAGSIAKKQAGKETEHAETGDAHEAGKPQKSTTGPNVIVAQSDELKNLTKKRTH